MDYQKIINYLEGKANKNEVLEVKIWLEQKENDSEIRQLLGEAWINSEIKLEGEKPQFDVMLNKIHEHFSNQKSKEYVIGKRPDLFLTSFYKYFSRIAAIIVLPLILFSTYLYFTQDSFPDSYYSMREIHTKPGVRTNIQLSDGTNVWLNDGTVLKYPEHFKGKTRTVHVDGEAYFEVESNKNKPFVVENPLMNTVVTGTKFNINAYSEDQFFEATLLEGKIHLQSETNEIELEPDQQIQYNAIANKMVRKSVNASNSAAWIHGKLIIYNEKLSVAIMKISRLYNVPIVIKDSKLNDYELTCTFENERIEQSLDLISQALPIKYSYIEKNINGKTQTIIELMNK